MNCDTARILFEFQRPGGASNDLTREDSTALDRHLADCSSCAARFAAERKFEASVGAAIRAVPIPNGLRERLIAKVEARRSALLLRRVIRVGTAVAAMILAIPCAYGVYLQILPAFNVESLLASMDNEDLPEQETTTWLTGQGLPAELPLAFEFRLHRFHGKEQVFDRDVPVVMFESLNAQGRVDWARVYIVRNTQFDLRDVSKLKTARGSLCAAEVYSDPVRADIKYVVLYTTQSLEPFLKANSHQLTLNISSIRKCAG